MWFPYFVSSPDSSGVDLDGVLKTVRQFFLSPPFWAQIVFAVFGIFIFLGLVYRLYPEFLSDLKWLLSDSNLVEEDASRES